MCIISIYAGKIEDLRKLGGKKMKKIKKEKIKISVMLGIIFALMGLCAFIGIQAATNGANMRMNLGVRFDPQYLVEIQLGMDNDSNGTIVDNEFVQVFNSNDPNSVDYSASYIYGITNDTINLSSSLFKVDANGNIKLKVINHDTTNNLIANIICGDSVQKSNKLLLNTGTPNSQTLDIHIGQANLGLAFVSIEIEVAPFEITYNYDNGSVVTPNQATYTYNKNSATIITLTPPTKTGHTFSGWATSNPNVTINGNSITIAAGTSSDIEIRATWNAITYSITYDYDGGSLAGGESNPTSYTYSEISQTKTLTQPTKTDYEFAGWTVSPASVTVSENTLNIPANTIDTISITATWESMKLDVVIGSLHANYTSMDFEFYIYEGIYGENMGDKPVCGRVIKYSEFQTLPLVVYSDVLEYGKNYTIRTAVDATYYFHVRTLTSVEGVNNFGSYTDESGHLGNRYYWGEFVGNDDKQIVLHGIMTVEHFCCFIAGTQILTSLDGQTKNIEDLKKGDYVVYYDYDSDQNLIGKVENTINGPISTELVYYRLEDGSYVDSTLYHPIYTAEGWKSATNHNGYPMPKISDMVMTPDGWSEMIQINFYKTDPCPTYNLNIIGLNGEDIDNYYAGGLLVADAYSPENAGAPCAS